MNRDDATRVSAALVGTRTSLGVVHASCGGTSGGWTCVTHDESFDNQIAKDSHIARGVHVLAWRCYECDNMETP